MDGKALPIRTEMILNQITNLLWYLRIVLQVVCHLAQA